VNEYKESKKVYLGRNEHHVRTRGPDIIYTCGELVFSCVTSIRLPTSAFSQPQFHPHTKNRLTCTFPKMANPKSKPNHHERTIKTMEREIQFLLLTIRSFKKAVCSPASRYLTCEPQTANQLNSPITRPLQASQRLPNGVST